MIIKLSCPDQASDSGRELHSLILDPEFKFTLKEFKYL